MSSRVLHVIVLVIVLVIVSHMTAVVSSVPGDDVAARLTRRQDPTLGPPNTTVGCTEAERSIPLSITQATGKAAYYV